MISVHDVLTHVLMNPISLIFAVTVVVLFVLIVPYLANSDGLRAYPGPLLAKLTHGWKAWAINRGHWTESVDVLHRKYGTFVQIAPNHVSIASPTALSQIYGHSSNAPKAPFYDAFATVKQRSVFNARSRPEHARKRRIMSHMFAPQSVRELEGLLHVHVDGLLRQWDKLCEGAITKDIEPEATKEGQLGTCAWKAQEGKVWFNCMPWYNFWAFDTISDLAFGSPFGMLPAARDVAQIAKSPQAGMKAYALPTSSSLASTASTYEVQEVAAIEMLNARNEASSLLGMVPPYWRPLIQRLPGLRRGVDGMRELTGLAVVAVARRLAAPEFREDMLKKLLSSRDENGNPMGPEELSAEAITLIVAGSDSVSNSACAITYYVARDQTVQQKLQAELDIAFGDVSGSGVVPFDATKRLPYLEAVINEGLRLHTTVGANLPRVAPPGGLTVLGHTFKEGTWVSAPLYSIHRMPEVWGEDANEFRPERWIEKGDDEKIKMQKAFAPFSVGPRSCIGRNLALMELQILIATVFRRYHIVLEPGQQLFVHESFVRKPLGCMVGMKRRDL
ncbi:hypothetical protein AcV5_002299 [Taiwanofungus camphoratus]|nr:hypothetical protein AcV5_002299 [Antrodia cinnamomea]